MTDPQIDALLIFVFAFTIFAALAVWLVLSFRRDRRAKSVGWGLTGAAVALAAAVWKLRTGGELVEVTATGVLSFLATLIVFAGAETRVNITQAILDPSKRSGSRHSKVRPKDFSG
jgi:uncharacterized membrane protein